MQGISESTSRALQLAEQRLAEAGAELQRRAGALRDVTSKRDAALAEVSPVRTGLVVRAESGDALLAYAPHSDIMHCAAMRLGMNTVRSAKQGH